MLFVVHLGVSKNGIIYGIIDQLEPERVRYVGLTYGVPRVRLSNHWTYSRREGQKNKLHSWLSSRKDRPEDVAMICLHEAEPGENLNDLERLFIARLREIGQADLNHTDGGEGLKGYRRSEESKAAISKKYRETGGPSAKLSWDDVNAIRAHRLVNYEPAEDVSSRYGVARTCIDRILNNTMWFDSNFNPEHVKPRPGGLNQRCKLTRDQVNEVRSLRKNVWVSAKSLAEKYGVSEPAIQGILKNRTYFDPDYDHTTIRPYEKGRWGK